MSRSPYFMSLSFRSVTKASASIPSPANPANRNMNIAAREASDIPGNPASAAGSPASTLSFDPAYAEAHDRRILIVDDEEPVRELFATYLNESYSCAQAPDTQEALELLSREPFALVLTDIRMPGLGGIELLRKISELYADTLVAS